MVDLKKLKEYTKDMKVLYVEDDKLIQKEINEFLKRFFPVVDLADDGRRGLELYQQGNYDLVVSDINIPYMDGIEMSKAILKENPNQSIIINSAYSESEYLLELINSGIEYYVLKPINVKQFTKAIYKIIKTKHNAKINNINNESIQKQNIELTRTIKEKSEIINSQNYKDNLTGLNNLCAFIHKYKENDKKQIEFTALMLLDIDNLQDINDIYGRDTGNQVLLDFSELLKSFAAQNDYEIYHTAGDQFVLLEQVTYIDTDKYEENLSALLELIKEFGINLNGEEKRTNVNATIGMSLGQKYPLEHADMALQDAKNNHKPYSVYNTLLDTTQEVKDKIQWRDRIEKAIKNNNIVPVYQPIVDKDGNVLKYESLIRILEIEDGEEKLILPGHFLQIAIENKQYDSVSSMMIFKVIDFLKTNEHTVSINLTYSDIGNKIFIQKLYRTIEEEKLGKRVIIEITENESIRDYKLLKDIIKRFRNLGVKIAIDDFGSGYSNFNQILEIHPEYIKIDGTLIENIDIDSHAFILTKAIVTFFHELGVEVIAEYVHSKEIHAILKGFNVDQYQGYYFSEPIRDI